MIASILLALRDIKSDVAKRLEGALIIRLCEELNHAWRERTLGPVATVQAFLLQVLYGNTACDHVPHLCGKKFTGEAYGQARARLPLKLFERLLTGVCEALTSCREETARWCGHRVWLVDGSSCSMPDTPELQTAYGQPGGQKPGCGFPVAHVLAALPRRKRSFATSSPGSVANARPADGVESPWSDGTRRRLTR